MAQWLTNPTRNHEVSGLGQWVKDLALPRAVCRLQTWLRSHVAVAGGYSSDLAPSLGTSICCGCGSRKEKEKKKAN